MSQPVSCALVISLRSDARQDGGAGKPALDVVAEFFRLRRRGAGALCACLAGFFRICFLFIFASRSMI